MPLTKRGESTSRPIVRVDDDTPADELADHLEARVRRLMAERARIACWGDGRVERRAYVEVIDDSLDEWLSLRVEPCAG